VINCEQAKQDLYKTTGADGLAINSVSLRKHASLPNGWTMKVSIQNHGYKEKPLPKLKVVFTGNEGEVLSSRIIRLEDYPEMLVTDKNIKTIFADEVIPLDIHFQELPWQTFGYDVLLLP
jgi:hypothetical protein